MLIEERANENREMKVALSYVKQYAANTFIRFKRIAKENGPCISLLGKGLTQEINGDGGFI